MHVLHGALSNKSASIIIIILYMITIVTNIYGLRLFNNADTVAVIRTDFQLNTVFFARHVINTIIILLYYNNPRAQEQTFNISGVYHTECFNKYGHPVVWWRVYAGTRRVPTS